MGRRQASGALCRVCSVEHNNPKIKPQAHSDMIRNPFNDYGHDLDVMIEAKHKELALLEYRNIMNKEKMAG